MVEWLLKSSRSTASARLQGYMIHEALLQRGIGSNLLCAPPWEIYNLPWQTARLSLLADSIQAENVVFHKLVDPRAEVMIDRLRQRGIRTIYFQCDYRPDNLLPLLCDTVVVPSGFLQKYYADQGKNCTRIFDPVEYVVSASDLIQHHTSRRNNHELRLVWVGNKHHWDSLAPLRSLLSEARFRQYQLLTISDHPQADIQWNLNTVREHLLTADIGVVPTGTGIDAEARSHNRATLFMGLGIPVIVGDIASYREIVQDEITGFIASSTDEWAMRLLELSQVERRIEIAAAALERVIPQFTLAASTQKWLQLFATPPAKPVTASETSPLERQSLQLEAEITFLKSALKKRSWAICRTYLFRAARALLRCGTAAGISVLAKVIHKAGQTSKA